ncbi:MAG: acyl-CoA synthetase [Bacillota bacterium]
MRRKIIAVLGDASVEEGSNKLQLAYDTGKKIIDLGYRLQCGGGGAVMKAASMGAHASEKYREGDVIGIIPSFDANICNEYIDISIPTGLDFYRNIIVANASAVVAVGGGCGTLCEMSSAWTLKRMMIAYKNCDGWSSKVADTKMDNRVRYPSIPEDKVFGITSAEELTDLFANYLDKYDTYFEGIKDTLG